MASQAMTLSARRPSLFAVSHIECLSSTLSFSANKMSPLVREWDRLLYLAAEVKKMLKALKPVTEQSMNSPM